MNKEMWGPMSDRMFKRIFGEEKEILIELLNLIIAPNYPIVELTYFQPELLPELEHDKLTIVDVRCKDDLGRNFIVEMQLVPNAHFLKRVYYNAIRIYGNQLKKGVDFGELKIVYAISIVNNNIIREESEWFHTFEHRRNGKSEADFNTVSMIILEVQKFIKYSKFDLNNRLHQWMRFFAEPEYFKHLPMELKSNYPNLRKAAIILDESKLTPGQQYTYDVYMDHIRCRNTEVIDSFRQGRLEGLQLSIAINKELKNGLLSHKEIAEKYTISVDEVKMIAEEMQ